MQDKNAYSIPGSILLGAVIIAGAIVYVGEGGSAKDNLAAVSAPVAATEEQQQSVPVPVDERDHVRGNPNAKVTLVEFSDFQCPYCRAFHPELQKALQEFGQDVRWVYKHFPLTSIHPEALPSAMASECVWEQKGDGAWELIWWRLIHACLKESI
ncbi:MAG: thioredoxin domain-containing protein [Candidatus Wildermuthbacteria bacterium]|nr:thioredoxin domain-containing protein [Candidatus Wildermuthbacteria bacterium]